MTSRLNQLNCAIGGCILILLSLFYVLHKTHSHMLNLQDKLYESETKLGSLTKNFDSLYEYKERLEKSFIALKNEKSSMMELGVAERQDFDTVRSVLEQKLKVLEEDLIACRKQEAEIDFHSHAAAISEAEPLRQDLPVGSGGTIPLLSPLSLASLNSLKNKARSSTSGGAGGGLNVLHEIASDRNDRKVVHGHETKRKGDEKEAIQSPIAHVPGQPSGDPNEDTVGNVLI